jgi:hypothetical protein
MRPRSLLVQLDRGSIVDSVSARLDPSWKVLNSHTTADVSRCVDVFERPDGSFGFEEFRRDAEDMGVWTPVAYYSNHEYPTADVAVDSARKLVPWLGGVLDG